MKYDYYSKNGLPLETAWRNLENYLQKNHIHAIFTPPDIITHEIFKEIKGIFNQYGLSIEERPNNRDAFFLYLDKVHYPQAYLEEFGDNFIEKAYEHFQILDLLALKKDQVYIDIAACTSPLWEIASGLFEADAFYQDIMYPEGIHGRQIGCEAGNLPFDNESVDAMSLACSLEHFENDSDIRFFSECERVLKKGGKCIVAPLYLTRRFYNMTDPVCWTDASFDKDATVCL